MKQLDINALFLGPKSEHEEFFRNMLTFMVNDHINWRKYFHPDDKALARAAEITPGITDETLQRTREALLELTATLQTDSVPWFSPRYLGHMTTDTLMPALLGYMLTLLYNPNNCAYEASPATTPMEIEVGRQLASMMGYDPQKAWGHITSGGTVANYEAMWISRNLRSIPFAMKKVMPGTVQGLSDWQLSNLPNAGILDLIELAKEANRLDDLRNASVRGQGVPSGGFGKWLVPQSKHYSWVKAADILGIGQDSLAFVRVKEDYRLDINDLKLQIDRLVEQGIPVLGVVAVVGTTEEGAVDEVHKVVALRREYEAQGIWFHIHVDAAYGGYVRAAFLNEEDNFLPYAEARQQIAATGIPGMQRHWPDEDIYHAFMAMADTDSITVDPHKLGYIPYAAGAIVMPDRRVLDTISYFAAYVFEKTDTNPMLLGSYIMEGSKAGAVVAAIWTAHRVVPLNNSGYGQLIRNSIAGAHRFYDSLMQNTVIELENRTINVHCLCKPDLNIVIYAFNDEGNTSLERMNALNQRVYEKFSYRSGPVYATDYIMSKTSLSEEEYGDMPCSFTSRFGIPCNEWQEVEEVFVLRSCILTPLLTEEGYKSYWDTFYESLRKKLLEITL